MKKKNKKIKLLKLRIKDLEKRITYLELSRVKWAYETATQYETVTKPHDITFFTL